MTMLRSVGREACLCRDLGGGAASVPSSLALTPDAPKAAHVALRGAMSERPGRPFWPWILASALTWPE